MGSGRIFFILPCILSSSSSAKNTRSLGLTFIVPTQRVGEERESGVRLMSFLFETRESGLEECKKEHGCRTRVCVATPREEGTRSVLCVRGGFARRGSGECGERLLESVVTCVDRFDQFD